MQAVRSSIDKSIDDLVKKAIVSGKSYTVDQAIKEAKEMYEKSGGQKIQDFYNEWYSNKDQVVLPTDIYK